jgi:hypothetical protein
MFDRGARPGLRFPSARWNGRRRRLRNRVHNIKRTTVQQ